MTLQGKAKVQTSFVGNPLPSMKERMHLQGASYNSWVLLVLTRRDSGQMSTVCPHCGQDSTETLFFANN